MGLQTKAIKQKIRSVKNIGKITKTMEMVSVAKMKKSTERVFSGRPFSRYAIQLLHQISIVDNLKHSFLEKNDATKNLLVVFGSNKGLAGSYNSNIVKILGSYKNSSTLDLECIAVGKKAEKACKMNSLKVVERFINFSDKSTSEDFYEIKEKITKQFLNKTYSTVSILFTKHKSATSYKPEIMKILPIEEKIFESALLDNVEDTSSTYHTNLAMYTFEPDEKTVLDKVLDELLYQILFHAFLESVASEHSSRMFAMKNANDNASNILEELTLSYNQARQAAITQELAEIVGGAAAMN
jgi:F-type H+-transporting ATPase subunit gamma